MNYNAWLVWFVLYHEAPKSFTFSYKYKWIENNIYENKILTVNGTPPPQCVVLNSARLAM